MLVPEDWDDLERDWALESQEVDWEQLKKSEDFGIKKYNNALYKGELVNGKREGRGVMRYRDGRVYEGHWH